MFKPGAIMLSVLIAAAICLSGCYTKVVLPHLSYDEGPSRPPVDPPGPPCPPPPPPDPPPCHRCQPPPQPGGGYYNPQPSPQPIRPPKRQITRPGPPRYEPVSGGQTAGSNTGAAGDRSRPRRGQEETQAVNTKPVKPEKESPKPVSTKRAPKKQMRR